MQLLMYEERAVITTGYGEVTVLSSYVQYISSK